MDAQGLILEWFHWSLPCLIPSLAVPGSCGIHPLSLVTTAAWFSREKGSFLLVHVDSPNSPACRDAAAPAWLKAGGKAAGNVLAAADLGLPSPSPGAAAAQLSGIGMCGNNHGSQKSWSVKRAGSELLTQLQPKVAAFVSPELLHHTGRTFQTFFPV